MSSTVPRAPVIARAVQPGDRDVWDELFREYREFYKFSYDAKVFERAQELNKRASFSVSQIASSLELMYSLGPRHSLELAASTRAFASPLSFLWWLACMRCRVRSCHWPRALSQLTRHANWGPNGFSARSLRAAAGAGPGRRRSALEVCRRAWPQGELVQD